LRHEQAAERYLHFMQVRARGGRAVTKIFISYRRDDSRDQARMIHDALRQVLPREHVFMDVDSIRPGADWVVTLESRVGECDIMLVLIGPSWIDAADQAPGGPNPGAGR
jgi:hypothetical protein